MRSVHMIRLAVPSACCVVGIAGIIAWHAFNGRSAAALQVSTQREFTISAYQYSFEPLRLEVQQNDLVKITFRTKDIPHSFTIDSYRIAKRVNAGQTVVFEFRADQAGRFPFYCNLTIDDGCRAMRGELIVNSK